MVPLLDENRIIVTEGLNKIKNTKNIGLKELIKQLELNDKKISAGKVGYYITPCINAHHRLKGSNQKSFELLITKSVNRAKEISEELIKLNELRKEETKKGMKIAKKQIENNNNNFVIIQGDFNSGVVGLIANDIKKEYNKPVIVFSKLTNGICKGSGRSLKPLHMKETIDKCMDMLENGGGHEFAAGMSIKKSNIPLLKDKIDKLTEGIEYEEIKDDMTLNVTDITYDLINELKIFQPYGKSNPSPKFLFNGKPKKIKKLKDNHLKFKIKNIECIAFGQADKFDYEKDEIKFIGSLEINKWRGKKKKQINVKKIL
jgi:single-stranded-DNA-specific exonuclease